MLKAIIQKNDKLAYQLIGVLSAVVFIAVVVLSKVTVKVDFGFNPHVFAAINATINSLVSVLLIWLSLW